MDNFAILEPEVGPLDNLVVYQQSCIDNFVYLSGAASVIACAHFDRLGYVRGRKKAKKKKKRKRCKEKMGTYKKRAESVKNRLGKPSPGSGTLPDWISSNYLKNPLRAPGPPQVKTQRGGLVGRKDNVIGLPYIYSAAYSSVYVSCAVIYVAGIFISGARLQLRLILNLILADVMVDIAGRKQTGVNFI